jgi:hypothetical protein
VRVHTPYFRSSDDALTIEPGVTRVLRLRPSKPDLAFPGGALTALNLTGRVVIEAS